MTSKFAKFHHEFISHNGLKVVWEFRMTLKHKISHNKKFTMRIAAPPMLMESVILDLANAKSQREILALHAHYALLLD